MKGHYDRSIRKVRVLKFREFMSRHLGEPGDLGGLARCMESEVRYPATVSQQCGLIERNPQYHRVLVAAVTAWQNEVHGI